MPVPDRLHFTAPLFLGETGNDLFLRASRGDEEEGPLLLRMTQEEKYMAPLAAFRHRRAYGNVKEDLLVPMGTALFTPTPQSEVGAHWTFRERIVVPDPETAHATLEVYHLPPVSAEEAAAEAAEGLRYGALTGALMSDDKGSGDWLERLMARRLDSLGWEKIAVNFRFPFFQAHNQICALSRNKVLAHLYREGRGVMDHAAQLLVEG